MMAAPAQSGGAGAMISPADNDADTAMPAKDKNYEALEMKGKLATASNVYAGMGMDFVSPKVPYDVSQYQGITFFAKRAPGRTAA